MCARPRLEELEHLHSTLSTEERDELLQCLLIAAPRGGDAMIRVLEEALLCRAAEELVREQGDPEPSRGCDRGSEGPKRGKGGAVSNASYETAVGPSPGDPRCPQPADRRADRGAASRGACPLPTGV